MNPSRYSGGFLASTLLISLVLLLVGCNPEDPQSTFDAKGPISRMQLDLFKVIFWAAVFVFVIVQAALVYTVIRFRRKAGAAIPRQVHGNTPLEIGWTIAPAIILIVIAVPTISVLFASARAPGADALNVRVIAHQWWWEFRYPDLGVVTANELHIPVGRDINIALESEDVIHSFWVPKLAGKVDIIPTRVNRMWFRADEPGDYRGQCAEFCGIAHALMRFRVIAQPPEEFQTWGEDQKAAAGVPTTDLEKKGAELFTAKGCVACHTSDGPPSFDQIGPNLTLFGNRTTLGAGIMDNTPQNVARWLRNPADLKPGNRMAKLAPYYQSPDQALSDEDISALVAYLQGLK